MITLCASLLQMFARWRWAKPFEVVTTMSRSPSLSAPMPLMSDESSPTMRTGLPSESMASWNSSSEIRDASVEKRTT